VVDNIASIVAEHKLTYETQRIGECSFI